MEQINAGYKQTEVGIIPEDWVVSRVDKVATLINGRGFKPYEWKKDGFPIIRIQNLNGSDDFNYFDGHFDPKILIKKGQLLFAWSGSKGTSFGPHIWNNVDGVLNYHTWKVNCHESLIDKDFFYYILLGITKRIEAMARGASALVHTQKWEMEGVLIGYPTSVIEQKAIATALSDADAHIRSLEALIEKKKALKQGAMQKLLTPPHKGGKRLAGFDGEWEEINMGNSSVLKARIGWQGLTTAEYLESGEYCLITGTDFNNGFIDWDNCVFVEKERYIQDPNIQIKEDDILVTKDGTIGKVAYIDKIEKPTTLNSGVFVIRPKNKKYVPRFLYYILMSSIFVDFLNRLTAGSTISHLYQKDFVHFNFYCPSNEEEQIEITNILYDMDKEISSLETEKAKYEAIKEGMAQELLTGKTRLI